MQVPNFNRTAIFVIATMFVQNTIAQQITTEQKTSAIQMIAKHIAANYVYPEKGGQIASHIQSANFGGKFQKASTWKEFNEMVTNELQSFSKDGHLYVRHNPEVVSNLKKEAKAEARSKVKTYDEESTSSSGIEEAKVIEGNVGYVRLKEFNFNKKNLGELYDAMRKVNGTNSLIIDLRDNSGGGSEVGAVLESYFLPAGKPILAFTKRDGNVITESTVNWLEEQKYDKPVFILVNNKTASAAEAFAFVLQQNRRAKTVGQRTAGAAYKNDWFAIDDENFVSVSTAAPSLPGENISWEIDGIQPDIKVKKGDALDVALRAALKN